MIENKNPKLSIITVCFNNKEGLRKTMKSVKQQSFKDYEYIVIDGASTDGTVELIKENEAYIDYWVSEKDSGIYNAMNKGIKVARGEYCYFLNSDDLIASPTTLEKIFEEVENKTDIIYGNLAVRKNEQLHHVMKFSKRLTPYSFFRHKVAIHHQASFIKRKLFETHGYYDENIKLISDWAFFFEQVIVKKANLQYINKVFAVFLAEGASSGTNPENINEKHIKERILKEKIPLKKLNCYKKVDSIKHFFFIDKFNKLLSRFCLRKALKTGQIYYE